MQNRDLLLSALLAPVAAYVAPALAEDFLTVAQAQQALFPVANRFAEHTLTFTSEQRKEIKKLAGTRQRGDQQQVWRADKNGELQGWFIIDEVIGKHEFITYALAISPEGKVLGIEVMSYRETHGGEVRKAEWRDQFTGKDLQDTLRLGKDISNISGATLSCRNLTDGVKRLLTQWDLYLRHG